MDNVIFDVGDGSSLKLEDAIKAASTAEADALIQLHGVIELERTLAIPPLAHSLTIKGADCAVISGGSRLIEFEPFGDGLYRTRVEETIKTRHLYIDGKPAYRPKTDILQPYGWTTLTAPDYEFYGSYVEREVPSRGELFHVYDAIRTNHTEIASWRNARDLEMVYDIAWTHSICPVERVEKLDDEHIAIYPVSKCFHVMQSTGGVQAGPRPNYIENAFELIRPGEWYLDKHEHMLYICLNPGDTPERHEIVLPRLEKLVDVSGSNVVFQNVCFQHSTYIAPAVDGHPEIQANVTFDMLKYEDYFAPESNNLFYFHKTPSAICVRGATDVRFSDCRFSLLGSGAIDFEHGAQDCTVEGCDFHDIAGSAVQIGDFSLEDAHPSSRSDIVRLIQIRDNAIRDTGFDYKGSVAVFIGYAQDITVEHNDIFNVSYTAVSVGWGWAQADMTYVDRVKYVASPNFKHWTEPSVCCRNKVLYNHIYNAMLLLSDGGAIYTLGAMEGSAIIGNLIHGSAGYVGKGYDGFSVTGVCVVEIEENRKYFQMKGAPGGIYMDEGTTGIEVSENILYDTLVPIHYHNQIRDGYKKVRIGVNTINKTPDDPDYPQMAAKRAGSRKRR